MNSISRRMGCFVLLLVLFYQTALSQPPKAEKRFVRSLTEHFDIGDAELLVLIHWSIDCLSCLEELPILQRMQKIYGPSGLKILGLYFPLGPSVGDLKLGFNTKIPSKWFTSAPYAKLDQDGSALWPLWPSLNTNEIPEAYAAALATTKVYIEPNGTVLKKDDSAIGIDNMEGLIRSYLWPTYHHHRITVEICDGIVTEEPLVDLVRGLGPIVTVIRLRPGICLAALVDQRRGPLHYVLTFNEADRPLASSIATSIAGEVDRVTMDSSGREEGSLWFGPELDSVAY